VFIRIGMKMFLLVAGFTVAHASPPRFAATFCLKRSFCHNGGGRSVQTRFSGRAGSTLKVSDGRLEARRHSSRYAAALNTASNRAIHTALSSAVAKLASKLLCSNW
jgi:hypothetical protein